MAVLGFQLVLTIILLSVLNKISGKYSLARYLLGRGSLIRYKHPTDQKLREAISAYNQHDSANSSANKSSTKTGSKKEKSTRRRHNNGKHSSDDSSRNTFVLPPNLPVELEAEPVSILHLINLPYYPDLQWLIDFSACTLFVYFTTEAYYFWLPERASKELNLSIVWCLLSLLYSLKCLFTITGMIFRQKDERSLIISFFCAFFLLSMVVLIPNEAFLEFGLVDAYKTFNENAIKLIVHTGSIDAAYGPISFLIFRFWLAITCGLLGAFFVYPGLRMGKMHIDVLRDADEYRFSYALKPLYHVSFLAPLFAVVLWIKPIARHYLTIRVWPNRGVLMSEEMFESVRLIFIVSVIFLRLSLFRHYLQAFLNIAAQKLTILKKDSNKITNADLQKQIAGVTYYLCVAALQFLAPLFIILFVTLITKSSGNYSWNGGIFGSLQNNMPSTISSLPSEPINIIDPSLTSQTIIDHITTNPAQEIPQSLSEEELNKNPAQPESPLEDNLNKSNENLVNNNNNNNKDAGQQKDGNAEKSAEDKEDNGDENVTKVRLELFKDVFNTVVLRGLSNFGLWWLISVWFTTSTLGYIYHNQFKTFL